jgi:hypothetical protein
MGWDKIYKISAPCRNFNLPFHIYKWSYKYVKNNFNSIIERICNNQVNNNKDKKPKNSYILECYNCSVTNSLTLFVEE